MDFNTTPVLAFVLLFSIIVYGVFWYLRKRPKVAILLTTCVKPQLHPDEAEKRLAMYREIIQLWLANTDLAIFVVDSTGYEYPEFADTRLGVITLHITEKHKHSSQYEAISLIYASTHEKLQDYDIIVKVTGRYFLPSLPVKLDKIYGSVRIKYPDIMYQHTHDTNISWQNSEIFGFRRNLAGKIFTPTTIQGFMEERISNIHTKFDPPLYAQRLLPIHPHRPTIRGGDKLVMTVL